MDVTKLSSGEIALTLTSDELSAIRQYLNEVCHGYAVPNFETRIGVAKEVAARLLDQTSRRNPVKVTELGDDKFRVTFTPEEARILVNAMNDTMRQIRPREYQTRIGTTVGETKQVQSAIQSLLPH